MKSSLRFSVVLISLLTLISCMRAPEKEIPIVVKNADFESAEGTMPQSWTQESWLKDANAAQLSLDSKVFKAGKSSGKIVCEILNDCRFGQSIEVNKGALYKISCWIKTENVSMDGRGANISATGILDASREIHGTNDWQLVEFYGQAGSKSNRFTVTVGIGGYGAPSKGTAWFDDLKIERVDSAPAGTQIYSLVKDETPTIQSGTTVSTSFTINAGVFGPIAWLMFLAFILVLGIFYFTAYDSFPQLSQRSSLLTLGIMLAVGFGVRVLFALGIEGHPTDISCFSGWANAAFANLTGFYTSDVFCDYPPFYIFILWIVGAIQKVVGYAPLVVKMPSILADLVMAILLYRFCLGKLKPVQALFIAALYALNPLAIINSAAWGQIDSFFTMILALSLFQMYRKKFVTASIFLALAILTKPQGIIFLPILLLELIRNGKLKPFLWSIAGGLITLILVVLPFSFKQDPFWIFRLYLKTIGEYPYTTINAFNLYALVGTNWQTSKAPFLFVDYQTFGTIATVFVVAAIAFLYFLHMWKGSKNPKVIPLIEKVDASNPLLPLVSSLFLIVGVFVLSTGMHERYMYTALFLSIIVFAVTQKKRFLAIFAALLLTNFANTLIVLARAIDKNVPESNRFYIPTNDPLMLFISAINVLAFAFCAWQLFSVLGMGNPFAKKGIEESQNPPLGATDETKAPTSGV